MRQCPVTEETPGELPVRLFRRAELWLSFGPLSKIHFSELVEQKKITIFGVWPKRQTCGLGIGISILALKYWHCWILKCVLLDSLFKKHSFHIDIVEKPVRSRYGHTGPVVSSHQMCIMGADRFTLPDVSQTIRMHATPTVCECVHTSARKSAIYKVTYTYRG